MVSNESLMVNTFEKENKSTKVWELQNDENKYTDEMEGVYLKTAPKQTL